MRILFIHTYYQQKGGEDAVFQQEIDLPGATHEVRTLTFRNQPGVKGAIQFFLSVWNVFAAQKLRKAIREQQPDIIHIHNWHFAAGPLIIRTARKKGIPVVMTLHNYRLLCPSATLLHNGSLFTDSLKAGFPWKAIRKKVYRNSLFQTFWLSFVIWLHKKMGTWKMVDTYIVLTDFAKNIFINSSFGVLEKKFVVKPNFIAAAESNDDNREDYFLFIGRLSEEKGVDTLLESFNQSGLPLCIGGDGPLKEKITGNGKSSNITYLGTLDKAAVQKKMQQCTALIFPSIWYEGMPMTLIEALASGTPVIASDLGAMATMISNGYNGVHFKAGNAGSLTEKANYWNGLNRNDRQSFYTNARISYETYYTPAKNKQQLLKIYHSVL